MESFLELHSNLQANVLEIGPGKGALTRKLLDKNIKISVCEIDPRLAATWKIQSGVLSVFEGDFIEIPSLELRRIHPFNVIANLPYAAGTPILKRLITDFQPQLMVLMFQKEVGRRLTSSPGSKEWGSLAMMAQNHYEIRESLFVPASSFTPKPKIDSVVVNFISRSEPYYGISSSDPRFQSIVKAAFQGRRKTLTNAWKGTRFLESLLEKGVVAKSLRAEDISKDKWLDIFDLLLKEV